MNEEAQKVLDGILAKEPRELTETDKAFLRARRSYVGKQSRQKFAEVFNEEPEAPEGKEPEGEKNTEETTTNFPPAQEEDDEIEDEEEDETEEKK